MIREIQLSVAGPGEEEVTEPPARILKLSVINGEAYLPLYTCDITGTLGTDPIASFEVNARSLHLALRAAIDDDPSETKPHHQHAEPDLTGPHPTSGASR